MYEQQKINYHILQYQYFSMSLKNFGELPPSFLKSLSETDIGSFILKLEGVRSNQFKQILSITDIRALYLCRKNISHLPNLSQLQKLQTLWLCFNNIQNLQKQLSANKEIKEIYLNNNQISTIEGFEDCVKLQKLNLAYNHITYISQQAQLPLMIKSLLLSKNRIQSVQLLCRVNLPSLESLYLSGNTITSARTLRRLNCPFLKSLYLDQNLILDYFRYDDIYLQSGGFITLQNVEYTLDQQNITAIKFGKIRAPRNRAKPMGIQIK